MGILAKNALPSMSPGPSLHPPMSQRLATVENITWSWRFLGMSEARKVEGGYSDYTSFSC